MSRDLPARPSLEHLKKQAKDLLDGHQRGDPAALARIRAAVPAFAAMTDEAVARAPFALHDAQSAIAREHGRKSWQELRDAVAAKNAEAAAAGPLPDELLRALMPLHFPEEVGAALKNAMQKRASARSEEPSAPPLAGALPLVALRDALFVPGALGPIHVGRQVSRAAIEAALARTPPTVAIFPQRAAEQEAVDADALYPVGCEAMVHARLPEGDRAWVILEGLRWITLTAVDATPDGYQVARVAPFHVEPGDASDVEPTAATLRQTARTLAAAMPGAAHLVAQIDALAPQPLADLVVANLSVRVAEKARFAAETRLVVRLRMAQTFANEQLAKGGVSAPAP
jgi:Lon protease-like protein